MTVAEPLALAAGVKVKVPVVVEMAGCVANRALLLLLTPKLSDWPDSSGGPALMTVAHPVTVWAPASKALATSAAELEEFLAWLLPGTGAASQDRMDDGSADFVRSDDQGMWPERQWDLTVPLRQWNRRRR